jgi:hypothetical protein
VPGEKNGGKSAVQQFFGSHAAVLTFPCFFLPAPDRGDRSGLRLRTDRCA